MIEKWYPTLERRRHAHLILLHQQLLQISLYVRVQETTEQGTTLHGLEIRALYRVGIQRGLIDPLAQLGTEQLFLPSAREDSKVVEVERDRKSTRLNSSH